ncbi:hypothetical protein MMC18_003303 [Xylographa bjoerkii]|nr:hypothetical protein [Xylographa bjoerkii]
MSSHPTTLTPPTSRKASRAGEIHVSQRLSADQATGLMTAMQDGTTRVQLHTRPPPTPSHEPQTGFSTAESSSSSSSVSSVATAPQEPASPSPRSSTTEAALPATYHAPSYTLIGLAVANDPVLRAKLEALPAAYHPPIAGTARPAKAMEQSAPKAGSQERWTYQEMMRNVGPVVRSEKRVETGVKAEERKKGKRRGVFGWMRGRL